MTDQEFDDKAIDLAIIGTDVDKNIINRQSLEFVTMRDNAFNKIADFCANDPAQRHLLMQTGSIALTNGVGTLPSDILSSHARLSSFIDQDGNVLAWIKNYNDFVGPTSNLLGYYWLEQNAQTLGEIHIKNIGDGGLDTCPGPIAIRYCFIPASATSIPYEIQNDAVAIFASLVKEGIEKHTIIP